MPRTKSERNTKNRTKVSSSEVKTKQEPVEFRQRTEDIVSLWISNFETELSTAVFQLEKRAAMFAEEIDKIARNQLTVINPMIAHKIIGELRAEKSFSTSSMRSGMFETASLLKHLNGTTNSTFLSSTTTTAKKKKQTDEGYLTAGETCSSNGDSARRTYVRSSSATRQSRPVQNTKRVRTSRSLSRSKMPTKNVTIQAPEKSTPEKSIKPQLGFGMVTPKVKPHTTVSVLRRPKQGEMAISMQGSPLLVSGVITETCANVNIPLDDGRVLSLQPTRCLRMSQIPVFDEPTRQQLATLRDNLNKVCKAFNE